MPREPQRRGNDRRGPVTSRFTCALTLAAALSAALAGGSCAPTPDTMGVTTIFAPDYGPFEGGSTDGGATNAGVHSFLERRCGTLDCHGQVGRPFRLFSMNGLRAANDSGIVVGLQPDTPDEIYSNYLSAIGLQPEETSRVVSGEDPVTDLLLVTKPTALETHKGGQVISIGDVSYVCLTTWLTLRRSGTAAERQVNIDACNQAAMVP